MHPAEELAHKLHNREHAKKPGHVYQIWQDGEITIQKSGDLLFQRTLHCTTQALTHPVPGLVFPETSGNNSYAFVASEKDAMDVRLLIQMPDTWDVYNTLYRDRMAREANASSNR